MTDRRRDELEAQIAASAHDDSLLLVYADWLQQHGDPRGELIALEAAARAAPGHERVQWRKRRTELFERHPELVPLGQRLELEWHLGFVRRVEFNEGADVCAVLEHPSLAFVRTVVFVDFRPDAELFPHLNKPSLRTIALGDPGRPRWRSEYDNRRAPDDLDPLLAALPTLEHLYVRDPARLTTGNVSSLDLGVIENLTLPMIGGAQLPRLERLTLQFSLVDWRTPATEGLDDLRAMIAAPPATLTQLELLDVDGDAVIAALIGSPLLARLRRLRLENPNLTLDGVRRITREAFGHVALEVEDPLLDDAGIARLREVFPGIETISPRMRQLLRRA